MPHIRGKVKLTVKCQLERWTASAGVEDMRRLDIEVLSLVVYRPDFVVVGVYVFVFVFNQGVICPRSFPQSFEGVVSRRAFSPSLVRAYVEFKK